MAKIRLVQILSTGELLNHDVELPGGNCSCGSMHPSENGMPQINRFDTGTRFGELVEKNGKMVVKHPFFWHQTY